MEKDKHEYGDGIDENLIDALKEMNENVNKMRQNQGQQMLNGSTLNTSNNGTADAKSRYTEGQEEGHSNALDITFFNPKDYTLCKPPAQGGGIVSDSSKFKRPLTAKTEPYYGTEILIPEKWYTTLGHASSYILGCINAPLPGAWRPSREGSMPISRQTISSKLKSLTQSGYIKPGPQGGYLPTKQARQEYCDEKKHYIQVPAPRFIPRGHLSEAFILSRIHSARGKNNGKITNLGLSRALHMNRSTVIRIKQRLSHYGLITPNEHGGWDVVQAGRKRRWTKTPF